MEDQKFLTGPNAGLVDYIRTGTMVVDWSDAEAFLSDELKLEKLMNVSDAQWRERGDGTITDAINVVLDATGEWDSCLSDYGNRQDATAYVDVAAAERITRRARLELHPVKLDPAAFIDRHQGLYLSFSASLTLAQAFARAEPETVLTYLDATERRYEQRWGADPHMADYQAKHKASHFLAREWTNAPEGDRRVNYELAELKRQAESGIQQLHSRFNDIDREKTEEIERLRSLLLAASDDLRASGSGDKADQLLLAINRPARQKS